MTKNAPERRLQYRTAMSVKFLASAAAVFLAVVFAGGIFLELSQRFGDAWAPIVRANFAAVVGLPMAAIAAFVIVAMFRHQSEEPLELELWGVKIRGAAGPAILWVVCFLAMTVAIRLLWGL